MTWRIGSFTISADGPAMEMKSSKASEKRSFDETEMVFIPYAVIMASKFGEETPEAGLDPKSRPSKSAFCIREMAR